MNRLRIGTHYKTLRPISEFLSAWYEAKKVGRPLNTFISFKPSDTNARSSSENGKLWTKLRNKLSQFARDHDFEATFVWSRETSEREGKTWPSGVPTDEHFHVLMWVPKRCRERFGDTVIRWFPAPADVDIRPAHYGLNLICTRSRVKRGTAASYLVKQAVSPYNAKQLMLEWQTGGVTVGKRLGFTTNLSPKAIEARAAARSQSLRLAA